MSAKIMGRVWDLDLPHAEMLVLLAMADHADHNGENIRPAVGLIAWKTGYSERQVHRIMRDLTKSGLIELTGMELGMPNTYRSVPAAGQPKPEYRDANRDRVRRPPVKMSDPPMSKRQTPPVKMSDPPCQNV